MKKLRFVKWGLAMAGLALGLHAQDATVGPCSWLNATGNPDTLPELKQAVAVEFPRELRETKEIGYVLYERPIDEKGNALASFRAATQARLEKAVDAAMTEKKYKPGRRGDQPVLTQVRYAVIFNPASAAKDGPEATPRLLDATFVDLPVAKQDERPGKLQMGQVWCWLAIDEHGKVTAVKEAPAEVAAGIEQAVRQWKFAPARRAGQPVAAEVRVPCLLRWGRPFTPYDTPPRPIHRVRPVYPRALKAGGYKGEVTMMFTIDPDGRVKNPRVVRSINHAFDEAALEAIVQFRFEPARLGGKPVPVKFEQTIIFQLEGRRDGGDDGIGRRGQVDMEKLPPELRYEVAPKMQGVVLPVYPYTALRDDRNGEATVTLLLDERGRVMETRVQSASAPEFGEALRAAAAVTPFAPALRAGEPTKTAIALSWDFNTVRSTQLVTDRDYELLRIERKHPEKIAEEAQLDEPLKRVEGQAMQYPPGLKGNAESKEVKAEFLVDTDGTVRLARIVQAEPEALGYAAVQAAASWRFEPPRVHGQPAVVRVRWTWKPKLAQPAAVSGI